jgi:hypothetical protein
MTAPVAPPPPNVSAPPRTKGVAIGVVLMVVAVVLGIVLIVVGITGIAHATNDRRHVPVAASPQAFDLAHTGRQSVWYETDADNSDFLPDLNVIVVSPRGERWELATGSEAFDSTTRSGGRKSFRVGSFRTNETGRFTVRAQGEELASIPPGTNFGIGPSTPDGAVLAIVGGILGGALLFLIGLVVLIVALVRRGRTRRAMYAPTGPMGPPMWGTPGAPMPGGGWAAPAPAPPVGGGWGAPPPPAPSVGWGAPAPPVAPTPGAWPPPDAPPPAPPTTPQPGAWPPPAPQPGGPAPGAPPPAPPPDPDPGGWPAPPSGS